MATTTAGGRLTEAHRVAQVRIGTQTVALLRIAWPLLRVDDIDGSRDFWLATSVAVLEQQHSRSAIAASRYAGAFRAAEIGKPALAVEATLSLPAAAVTTLEVLGPVRLKTLIGAGVAPAIAAKAAFSALARTSSMRVLDGGRQTLERDIRRDRSALGYQRVSDGDPCYFCAMLASRGPVYSKRSFDAADVHPGCGCTLEPVYSPDTAWVGRATEFRDLRESAPDVNAFRAAYEGR